MPATRAAIRFITLFFLLAGILLLRKPVFGQTIAAPQDSQLIESVTTPTHRILNRIVVSLAAVP
jgi:hypothetical protein